MWFMPGCGHQRCISNGDQQEHNLTIRKQPMGQQVTMENIRGDKPAIAAALKTDPWDALLTNKVEFAVHVAHTAARIPHVLPFTRKNVSPAPKTELA